MRARTDYALACEGLYEGDEKRKGRILDDFYGKPSLLLGKPAGAILDFLGQAISIPEHS